MGMNTTQRAAAAHARWTVRTFGIPNEVQSIRIARDFAKSRGFDEQATYSAMVEVWAAAEQA